jgi:hypothetical protein
MGSVIKGVGVLALALVVAWALPGPPGSRDELDRDAATMFLIGIVGPVWIVVRRRRRRA